MTDLDRLPRRVARGWDKSAGALIGRQPPLYLADLIERALAHTLREIGDLSPIGVLESLAAAPCDPLSHETLRRFAEALPREFRTGLGSEFVQSAWGRLEAKALNKWPSPAPVGVLILGLQRTVDKCLFGPCGPELDPKVFRTYADFRAYRTQVMRSVRFSEIARRVVASDYDCSKLRSPARRAHRTSTSEILGVALE